SFRCVMVRPAFLCLVAAGWLLGLAAGQPACGADATPQSPSDQVDFTRQIRPILANRCFRCHGPDDKARQADLRLDSREGATAARDEGHAIVPAKPDESLLIARVTEADDDERMPPKDAGARLSAKEIELLRRWVAQGAEYKLH